MDTLSLSMGAKNKLIIYSDTILAPAVWALWATRNKCVSGASQSKSWVGLYCSLPPDQYKYTAPASLVVLWLSPLTLVAAESSPIAPTARVLPSADRAMPQLK